MELEPTVYLESFVKSHAAIAMRSLSLVFAKAMDLPVLAIDYSYGKGKVGAFAEDHGIPYQLLEELNAELMSSQLLRMLREPDALGRVNLKLDTILRLEILLLFEGLETEREFRKV